MKRVVLRTALALTAALALAGSAFAGTTGKLSGLVTDGTSALPGVTVTATSPTQIGGAQIAVTDETGTYSFPALTPGNFNVKFELDGFAAQEAAAVAVRLDRTTELNAQLATSQIAETITVTGEAPVVDPEQVSISQTFDQQYLDKIVVGTDRSYQDILGQAAGSVDRGGNPSVFGSTDAENAYYIDGVNTTDPVTATFGTNFNFDAIQEINFETAGFQAEYGGATGGLVNVITKSGGNALSGTVDVRFRNNDLVENGDFFDKSTQKSEATQIGATFGGPIVRDRIWYFLAAQNDVTEVTPDESPTTQKFDGSYYLGKLTAQLGSNWQLAGKYSADPADVDNANASQTVLEEANLFQEQGGDIVQADLTGTLSSNLLWNLRGGINRQELNAFPQGGDFDLAGHTDVNGVEPDSVNYTNAQYSKRDRDQLLTDLSWFVNGGGAHEIKAGVGYEKLDFTSENFTVSGYRYEDDGALPFILWFEPNPGAAESSGKGTNGFLQDNWTIGNLALSLGARWDAYKYENNAGTEVASLDKAQPRLGLAWDILGDATTVARASWGRFMHPNATTLPNFARTNNLPSFAYLSCSAFGFGREDCQDIFAGDITAGGLTVPGWLLDPQGLDPNGYLLVEGNIFSSQPGQVVSDLDAMYAETLVVGIERQIAPRTSIEVSYVEKKTRDIFEDTCDGNVPTPNANAACDFYVISNFDSLRRDYEGFLVRFESRGIDWLTLQASYTYSKSKGSIEDTQNAGIDYDVFPEHFDNVYGYLSDDRRHRVKINGAVELPLDFTVGFAGLWGSEFAYSKTHPVDPYGTEFVDPRGSFRADDTFNIDLEVRKAFQLGPVRTAVIATLQNVTSEESVTQVCENEDGCGSVDFGGALNHARPRRYQVGLRFEF
jgi:hypothetical protein